MAKIVMYNGGTESYCGCSEPTELVRGKKYEVVYEDDRGCQTNYTLKGIKGYFNSCWFDEVSETTFIAISPNVPEVGKRYECYKLEFEDEEPKLIDWLTSTVTKVLNMCDNIYKVTTTNSVYIVLVR